MTRSFTVRRNDPHLLQDFLSVKSGLSRRAAKAAIDARRVWVDGKCVWMARHELKTGSEVSVAGGETRDSSGARETGRRGKAPAQRPRTVWNIRILWQDGDYLVCDKPAGILSTANAESRSKRNVEEILREQEGNPELRAVHRLDRDTSGCMLFAKSRAALDAAVEMFKTHSVSKTYHAIAAGAFEYARRTIEAPIDGKRAVSHVSRETATRDASFLRIKIETGRTNQIRRHLASIRHPVLGDRVFGFKNAADRRMMQIARQMLHASTLELPHPLHPKDAIKVHSPLPADFRATLRMFSL